MGKRRNRQRQPATDSRRSDDSRGTPSFRLSTEFDATLLALLASHQSVSSREVERACSALVQAGLLSKRGIRHLGESLVGPSAERVVGIAAAVATHAQEPAARIGQVWFPVVVEHGAERVVAIRRVRCTITQDPSGELAIADRSSTPWSNALRDLLNTVAPRIVRGVPAAAPSWWLGRVSFEVERPGGGVDDPSRLAAYSRDRSFGLACAVALISAAFGVELPGTAVAMGALDERTAAVEPQSTSPRGEEILALKLRGVRKALPSLSRLYVAYDDAAFIRHMPRALLDGVHVEAVRSVDQLVANIAPSPQEFRGSKLLVPPGPVKLMMPWITLGLGSPSAFAERFRASPTVTSALGELHGAMLWLAGLIGASAVAWTLGWLFPGAHAMAVDFFSGLFAIGILAAVTFAMVRFTKLGLQWLRVRVLTARYRLDRPTTRHDEEFVDEWYRQELKRDPRQESLKLLQIFTLARLIGAVIVGGGSWTLAAVMPPAPLDVDPLTVLGVAVAMSSMMAGHVLVVASGRRLTYLVVRHAPGWRALWAAGVMMRRRRSRPKTRLAHSLTMNTRILVLDRAFNHAGAWSAARCTACVGFVFVMLPAHPHMRELLAFPAVGLGAMLLMAVFPVGAFEKDIRVVRRRVYGALWVLRSGILISLVLAILGRLFWTADAATFFDNALLPTLQARTVPGVLVPTSILVPGLIGIASYGYFAYLIHGARLPPGLLGRLVA